MSERGQFVRPALWGIGAGPEKLLSIAQAEEAVVAWLAQMPDHPRYAEERDRLLALRQLLRNTGPVPSPADVQSAKAAIKGFVRFMRLRDARRQAAYSSHRETSRP